MVITISICNASHCSRRGQCKKYFRNMIKNNNDEVTHQYMDWSIQATGSVVTDKNGKSYYKEKWACGDWSETYPLFDKIIDRKPKDLQEVKDFIYDCLEEKYGKAVISKKEKEQIVIDTQTSYFGNSDVWIKFNYFH